MKAILFKILVAIIALGLAFKWRFPIYTVELGFYGIIGAFTWILMALGAALILTNQRRGGIFLLLSGLLVNSAILAAFGVGIVPLPFLSESTIGDSIGGWYPLVLGLLSFLLAVGVAVLGEVPVRRRARN